MKKSKSGNPSIKKSKENKASVTLAEDEDWVVDDEENSEEDDFLQDESDEVGVEEQERSTAPVLTKINQLKNGMNHVTVEAKIDFVGEGNRKGAGYGENIYVPAFLKDETGEIKLMFWNDDARKAKAGKKVRVVDGFVSQFRGELQLNTNKKKGAEFL